MAKQTIQDLLEMIIALQSRIEVLESEKTVKRGGRPQERSVKPYAKLNGHYFKLNTDIMPADELASVVEKINLLLDQPDYKSAIEKNQLGRAIMSRLNLEKPEIYFWTPNQEQLMYGQVRSGMKNTSENELFQIDLNYLIDLGDCVTEKTGKTALENQLNFEEFKKFEIENDKIKKLQNKLNELNNK
ncbi:MAG: hypothetical protein RL769_666 [Pseudomonadota bacterium]